MTFCIVLAQNCLFSTRRATATYVWKGVTLVFKFLLWQGFWTQWSPKVPVTLWFISLIGCDVARDSSGWRECKDFIQDSCWDASLGQNLPESPGTAPFRVYCLPSLEVQAGITTKRAKFEQIISSPWMFSKGSIRLEMQDALAIFERENVPKVVLCKVWYMLLQRSPCIHRS